jgi:DNA-binding protein H-NS
MGFELGKVLPPHIADTLELSVEQLKQIADLEKDVKAKLTKILTAGQVKKAEASKGLGKMEGKDGKDAKGRDGKDKGKDGAAPDKKSSQPRPAMDSKLQKPSQIQWYASLDRGLKEAQRTGLPILLLSAAPHCAGVSGTW